MTAQMCNAKCCTAVRRAPSALIILFGCITFVSAEQEINHHQEDGANPMHALLVLLSLCFVIIGCMILCVLCGPGRYIPYVRDDHSHIFNDGDESPYAERRPLRMGSPQAAPIAHAQVHQYDRAGVTGRFSLSGSAPPQGQQGSQRPTGRTPPPFNAGSRATMGGGLAGSGTGTGGVSRQAAMNGSLGALAHGTHIRPPASSSSSIPLVQPPPASKPSSVGAPAPSAKFSSKARRHDQLTSFTPASGVGGSQNTNAKSSRSRSPTGSHDSAPAPESQPTAALKLRVTDFD